VQVRVNDLADLAARLRAAGGSLRPALAAGAAALARAIQDHYRSRPSRSGFWARQVAGGKVQVASLTEERAVVTIDSYELAHKVRGGTVRPIAPRKALAIPLTDEARLAGYPSNNRIPGLFRPKGTRVLAVKNPGSDSFRALWALVPSVTHRADPGALPPEAALRAASTEAMRQTIVRALLRR
jgi:hypothetical protein